MRFSVVAILSVGIAAHPGPAPFESSRLSARHNIMQLNIVSGTNFTASALAAKTATAPSVAAVATLSTTGEHATGVASEPASSSHTATVVTRTSHVAASPSITASRLGAVQSRGGLNVSAAAHSGPTGAAQICESSPVGVVTKTITVTPSYHFCSALAFNSEATRTVTFLCADQLRPIISCQHQDNSSGIPLPTMLNTGEGIGTVGRCDPLAPIPVIPPTVSVMVNVDGSVLTTFTQEPSADPTYSIITNAPYTKNANVVNGTVLWSLSISPITLSSKSAPTTSPAVSTITATITEYAVGPAAISNGQPTTSGLVTSTTKHFAWSGAPRRVEASPLALGTVLLYLAAFFGELF